MSEYLDGYNAGHRDGQAAGEDSARQWRRRWLDADREIRRLRLEARELRLTITRLLAPDCPVQTNRDDVVDEHAERDADGKEENLSGTHPALVENGQGPSPPVWRRSETRGVGEEGGRKV